ncbi:uncharacterized protein [Ptychodera flava]|uniref:uncharacterized protein isoform X3 n=1 Tax=Ptychodera flava TaxID=63121 RepID=UPI003969F54F
MWEKVSNKRRQAMTRFRFLRKTWPIRMLSIPSRSSPTRTNLPKVPYSREFSRNVEADDGNQDTTTEVLLDGKDDALPMASTSSYDPNSCQDPLLSDYDFYSSDPGEHVRAIFERLVGGLAEQKTVPVILDFLDTLSSSDLYCQVVQRLAEGGLEYCLSRLMDKWDQVFTEDTSRNDAEVEVLNVIRLLWTMGPYATVLRRISGLKEDLFPIFNELLQRGLRLLHRLENDDERMRQVILFEQPTISILQNCLLVAGRQEDVHILCHIGLIETIVEVLRRSRDRTTGEACVKSLLFIAEYGPLAAMVTLRDCYVIRALMKFWDLILRENAQRSVRPVAPLGLMIARIAQLLGQPETVHCSLVAKLPREKRLTLKCTDFKMITWCSYAECGRCQRDFRERFKVCSLCKICRYCSESCQKLHWDAGHKQECFQIGTLPRHFTDTTDDSCDDECYDDDADDNE